MYSSVASLLVFGVIIFGVMYEVNVGHSIGSLSLSLHKKVCLCCKEENWLWLGDRKSVV